MSCKIKVIVSIELICFPITSIFIHNSLLGQSLGYGFVNFIRTEDAENAVKSMNGLRLQNKTIKVINKSSFLKFSLIKK